MKYHDGSGYVVAKRRGRILDRTGLVEVEDISDPNVNHLGCIWYSVDEDFCGFLDMTLRIGTLRRLKDGLPQGTLVYSILDAV